MTTKRARPDGRILPGGPTGRAVASKKARRSQAPQRRRPSSTTREMPRKQAAQLNMAEETLRAIQTGEVDAFVVSDRRTPHVVTLAGGESAYRMLVEAMSEGAATLSRDGVLFYCNRRLAELMRTPRGKVVARPVTTPLESSERVRFKALLAGVENEIAKGEFNLCRGDGSLVPVHISLSRLQGYMGNALSMVITDLSEQKRKQVADLKQADAMHRLLLERTFVAQEEERRRITRELHDEAGQLLTSLLVGLRTLEGSAKRSDIKTQGHRLRKLAARAIDEIGRLARGLHPTVLEDHGLGVALDRYITEFAATHKIAVRLTPRGFDSSDMPLEVQIGLYRILQEALTNVARHAGAKKVRLTFAYSTTALDVAVCDDGCGMDTRTVIASSQRLGIQTMRERAAMLGGTVSLTSGNKGTRVLVRIPLPPDDAQPLVKRPSEERSNGHKMPK